MNTKMMYAYAAVAPGTIEKISLPIPEPDDYEVLVKNEGCVFCNTTDKMIVENLFATPDYPVVFGHESFGKVIKVGKKVKKFRLGDRVICTNAIVNDYNGQYYSSWGGFAEYGIAGDLDAWLADGGSVEGENSYRYRYIANCIIPDDLPYKKACLVFPLAETASAVAQVGDITDKTVVVLGTGMVGYCFVSFAKAYGAGKVICLGRRESRLAVAREAGADMIFIDVDEAAREINALGGADVVFECSGNHTVLEKGLPYMKPGGILAVYAVPHQSYVFDLLNCPERFSYMRIAPDVPKALDFVSTLLREDRINTELFLTHQWDFDQVPTAYEAVCRGDVVKGLVVIHKEVNDR